MTRGNRKALIFEDDHDRERFLDIMVEGAERHCVRIFAECRLGNHYHQVVQTPRANLPDYKGYLNGGFTQFSNHRHRRIGHLFNERYQPILIDNSLYLRIATSYVLSNPVKHGFVDQPRDWAWSSYRATAGLETPPDYLYLDWLIEAFPSASLDDAQGRFCRYLEAPTVRDAEEWIERPLIGSSEFERQLRQHIGATLFMSSLPRSYRALDRPPLSEIFRPAVTREERNRQMLRAHVLHAYSMSEIARAPACTRRASAESWRRCDEKHACVANVEKRGLSPNQHHGERALAVSNSAPVCNASGDSAVSVMRWPVAGCANCSRSACSR